MAAFIAPDSESTTPTRIIVPLFPTAEMVIPGIILAVLTLAELVTAAIDARIGLALHALLMAALIALGVRTTDTAKRELYWTLTLAPVVRIGSMAMPLGRLQLLDWYPIIGIPLFSTALFTAHRLGYTWQQLGLTLRFADIPRQLAMVPLGALLGIGEYLIFRPAPIVDRFTFEAIVWPALMLLIFTGLEEELIFRGLMQRAALRALGRWGLVYVNLIFSVLHIGYLSILDLIFVFLVGFLFSLFVLRTKSILGVTIAHGAVNIVLFLILPYLAPIMFGTGYADLLLLPQPIAPVVP